MLRENAYMKLTADLKICRVLNGMWQVSGAHGKIDPQIAVGKMVDYANAGFITWDLADHYGPAEDFVKMFRLKLNKENRNEFLKEARFFTKWVPSPQKITKKIVERAVDISRTRMGMDKLDMLQFHWWDYQNMNFLKALQYLEELKKEGKIRYLSLTNFDTRHIQTILESGVELLSNQVQFSLIDRRPERKMVDLCQKYDIKLLAYGTLCGGLLSEKYLNVKEPQWYQLNTASLKKYKNMIDRWGNWILFQELLTELKEIAQTHKVSIPNLAVRYILDKPMVAGVIIGARLGISSHIQENARVFDFSLSNKDHEQINKVLLKSNDLFAIIGDCGDEYR